MRVRFAALFTGVFGFVSLAAAQSPVAARSTLTLDGAKRVLAACEAEAAKNHAGGVIAVVDDGGNLIAVHRIDGTFAAGANISIGKARTAALFKKPTKAFEDIIKNGRTAMVALNDFTPLQGGVPIAVEGQIVGAVGVSGAASAQQDEEIAMAGARALESTTDSHANANSPKDAAATPAESGTAAVAETPAVREVMHFAREQMMAAFERGATLLNEPETLGVRVNASRRDQPGEAEIHERDTDVFYIVSGAATFVSGGELDGPRAESVDEKRGTSIRGGNTQSVAAGDVLVIPRGVPHWFREIQAPVTYHVVKVTCR